MSDSALDQVVEAVRAALHGRRASALEAVQRIERALAEYTAAIEEQQAREFAREHALAQPKVAHDAGQAARALREAVLALPELAHTIPPADPAGPLLDVLDEAGELPRAHEAPIVVVGGVPKRERAATLPAEVNQRLEWIDTTRQGTLAIGNLTQRIRAGRVAGLVLLEGLVGHRHSEPLVSAAREAGIPWAYAGKGGSSAFERALGEVLKRLG